MVSPLAAPDGGAFLEDDLRARRSATQRSAWQKKLDAMPDPGVHPCLWCGATIDVDRVKNAIARRRRPVFCSDECRRNDPSKSLIARLFQRDHPGYLAALIGAAQLLKEGNS